MPTFLLTLSLVLSLPQSSSIQFQEVLTIGSLGKGGRVPFPTNALLDDLVHGTFVTPKPGGTVESAAGGAKSWRELEVGKEGWFESDDFSGGFAWCTFDSPKDQVMALEAMGHNYVYVNGEPRYGDPYSFGFVRTPIQVSKGTNTFLFNVGRGRLKFSLVPIASGVFIEKRDSTLPDLITGESGERMGAVIVTNSTPLTMRRFVLTVRLNNGKPSATQLPDLPPMMSMKVPFGFVVPKKLSGKTASLSLSVSDAKGVKSGDAVAFDLAIKDLKELHKRTYVSSVDGSVQYYAVNPARENTEALVLSVHGAGVEATGQAAAYGQKDNVTLIAPTNRRPYGFDWEDWGRIDALEVLADAKRIYEPQEDRIYLTGHSMGGHGAWYLSAMHPDYWGAIGPAAGWINFWSYGGAVAFENPDPIEQMLLRVSSPSDPLKVIKNYAQFGVYVLHGDADDTVPVTQARDMRAKLSEFHRDVDFHEEPGQGHWYDTTPEPGADCVDYEPMFEFFDKHRRRQSNEVRSFSFSTVSPQLNASCYWATIQRQIVPFETSTIEVTNSVGANKVIIKTTNVSWLSLELEKSPLSNATGQIEVEIDGENMGKVDSAGGSIGLEKTDSGWDRSVWSSPPGKTKECGGPFKSVFNNHFVLVYGTTGTSEENAWSLAKARFDAETWWYRSNGYAEIVSDVDYLSKLHQFCNVIVYGSEDTNAAAKDILTEIELGPTQIQAHGTTEIQRKPGQIQVGRSKVVIGDRTLDGDDLGLIVVGRRDDVIELMNQEPHSLLFAVIGGTGIKGMRATNHIPYFVSGVHFPDITVFRSNANRQGTKAIELAGLFGNDWSVENGEMVWRK